MSESEDPPPTAELGAALRFFQNGSDVNMQGSSEALNRLAEAIHAAAEHPVDGSKLTYSYIDPDESEPGRLEVEVVDALTVTPAVGRTWQAPVFGAIGIVWLVILPLLGIAAVVLLLVKAFR